MVLGFPHIHKLSRNHKLISPHPGPLLLLRKDLCRLGYCRTTSPSHRSYSTQSFLTYIKHKGSPARPPTSPRSSQQPHRARQPKSTFKMATTESIIQGVNIAGSITEFNKKILSKDAVAFLALLHRSFNATRKDLLRRRDIRQAELDKGSLPDFLPETKHIRENDAWRGAKPAPGLIDRRVEITGPTDRKMVVNALNSNVWTYMADFEGEHRISMFMESAKFSVTRFECANVGQHDQRTSEPLRCYP